MSKTEAKVVSVTGKETKDVLLNIIKDRDAYIKELEAQTITPEDAAARRLKLEAITKASESIDKGIFSDDVKGEYKALVAAVAEHEARLTELYGLDKKYISMATAISAHNTLTANLKEDEATKRKEIQAGIADAKKEAEAEKERLEESNDEYRRTLAEQQRRDEEEYNYNLKIRRRDEADRHQAEMRAELDDVARIRKETEEKLASANALYEERAEELKRLESIDDEIKAAYEHGAKDGSAAAGKDYAFEKRTLESNHANAIALLNAKVETLTGSNAALKEENDKLSNKLDAAYDKIQAMAMGAVNAVGSSNSSLAAQAESTSRK